MACDVGDCDVQFYHDAINISCIVFWFICLIPR